MKKRLDWIPLDPTDAQRLRKAVRARETATKNGHGHESARSEFDAVHAKYSQRARIQQDLARRRQLLDMAAEEV